MADDNKDKGIENLRQGSVTLTVRQSDGRRADIVLGPGCNRVSAEQLRLLKDRPMFRNLMKSKKLRVTDIDDESVPATESRALSDSAAAPNANVTKPGDAGKGSDVKHDDVKPQGGKR